jgi:hypothetical protein
MLNALFGFARAVVWPIVGPMIMRAFQEYIKDHERAAKIDEAVFAGVQATTAKEKLDASKKLFDALKR